LIDPVFFFAAEEFGEAFSCGAFFFGGQVLNDGRRSAEYFAGTGNITLDALRQDFARIFFFSFFYDEFRPARRGRSGLFAFAVRDFQLFDPCAPFYVGNFAFTRVFDAGDFESAFEQRFSTRLGEGDFLRFDRFSFDYAFTGFGQLSECFFTGV